MHEQSTRLSDERHSAIVATFHDDYLIEELSDHYYTADPDRRGHPGVYVTPVFNGNVIEVDAIPQDLRAKLSIHVQQFFPHPEQDYNALTYYQVMCIGGEAVMYRFLNKCVTVMCNRIDAGVLDCEDDHMDFFHSTLELLAQIALEWGLMRTLQPLQESIITNHVPECKFEALNQCWLPSILADYL